MTSFHELLLPFIHEAKKTGDLDTNIFSTELKKFRIEELKLSPKEMAIKLNIAYSTYSAYERGLRIPKLETLFCLYNLIFAQEKSDKTQNKINMTLSKHTQPFPLVELNNLNMIYGHNSDTLLVSLSQMGYIINIVDIDTPVTLTNELDNDKTYTFENCNEFFKTMKSIYHITKIKAERHQFELINKELSSIFEHTKTGNQEGN